MSFSPNQSECRIPTTRSWREGVGEKTRRVWRIRGTSSIILDVNARQRLLGRVLALVICDPRVPLLSTTTTTISAQTMDVDERAQLAPPANPSLLPSYSTSQVVTMAFPPVAREKLIRARVLAVLAFLFHIAGAFFAVLAPTGWRTVAREVCTAFLNVRHGADGNRSIDMHSRRTHG
jgi:hypothetical protein